MISVAPVVGASVPTVGGRGGKRGVKPGPPPPAGGRQPPTSSSTPPHKPPPPAGGEAPWGGGKRSVKERETETTPADRPQDFPATGRRAVKPGPPPPAGGRQPWGGGKRNMKPRPPLLRRKRRLWTFLVRPGRSRFHSAPKTARQGWPGFQPAPKTARQGWPGFQPTPKTARHRLPGCHTRLLEQRSGRAGADATTALGRAVGRAPRHHPVDPSPGMPIAL